MRSNRLLLGVTLCLLLAPAALPSQISSVGEPFRLDLPGGESQLPDVATGGDGNFVVVWRESPGGTAAGVSARRVEVAADGLTAQVAGGEIVVEAPQPETGVTRPGVAMDDDGRFVVVWGEGRSFESCVEGHRFDPLGVSLGRIVVDACSPVARQPQTSVAITPDGRFAIAWDERTGAGAGQQAVFLRLFTESAQPRGVPVRVSTSAPAADPSVALDFLGRPAVVWERNREPFLRLFGATGQPRSGEISMLPIFGAGPQVAAAASGKLVTAATDGEIGIRLFTAAGEPYERVYFTGIQEPPAERVGIADLAADSLGNFVVVWEEDWVDTVGPPELQRPQIFVQAFNNRRAPQGSKILLSPGASGAYTNPAVALREDGTFLVTWESRPPGGPSRILGQLFAVRESDNFCVYQGQDFRCATMLLPSFFNEPVRFGRGLAAGDRPFLADVDGDGDDDPCVRRGGAFLCDTAQDGGDPEVTLPFGAAAHVPLLGDLDGDGDDDPCVRRGRTFLCDAAHDGGEAEVKILFGLASDLPVLGDADGDGDDDPCVLRVSSGIFLCDTDHDGQRDLIQAVPFVEPGDRPVMGDRGFCVARGHRLLCVIDANGNFVEASAGRRGDYPLLGNIDGF